MSLAVYPGTFDPITRGHIDLVERGSKIFDELIVAIGRNPAKKPLFTIEERVTMVREEVQHVANVRVDSFEGLVVHYVKSQRTNVIFRGMRNVADFDYEFQMALTNRACGGDIETVFVMPSQQYAFLNSGLIKEVAAMGGDVTPFVTPGVEKRLKAKLIGE